MKDKNTINKIAGLMMLLAFLVNSVMPFPGAWGVWVMRVGVILMVVHSLEFVVVYKRLKAISRATAADFFWVLLLGFVHWKPLLKK